MQNRLTVDAKQFSIPQVFYLSELATILHMPESLVQNWTMGRPLRITPHRSATGSGSRNLYAVNDLYRFGIARHLSMDGFAPHAIQSIVDAMGSDFSSAALAIVTCATGGSVPWKRRSKPHLRLVSKAQYDRHGWSVIEHQVSKSVGCYVLSIPGITQTVNDLIAAFLQRKSANPPRKPVVQRTRPVKPAKEEPSILGLRGRKFRDEE